MYTMPVLFLGKFIILSESIRDFKCLSLVVRSSNNRATVRIKDFNISFQEKIKEKIFNCLY